MPITINTNVSAMISQRNLAASSARSASSLSKLSSGSRVPSAKEDAASLAVGTGLRLDVSALKAAQVNAQQATSMLQIADGAFGQISDVLTRMKSLATTAQSAQLSDTERGYLNDEFLNLQNEIDRIAGTTEFNGTKLLGGESELTETGAAATGLVGVNLDSTKINAGDTFGVAYVAGTNTLTVQNNITGDAQSLTVPTVPTGGTQNLSFGQLGVELTIDDTFNGAGLSGLGATEFTASTAGGVVSQQADLDFQVGTTAGDVINVKIDQGNYKSLVNGPQEVEVLEANINGGVIDFTNGEFSYEVDGNLRSNGEFVTLSYDDTAGSETLSLTVYDADPTGAANVVASQAVDISGIIPATGSAIAAFDELGIDVTFTGNSVAAAITPDLTNNFEITNVVGADRVTADISSVANAQIATGQVDDASVSVNTARANLGSNMNRLEFASSNLAVTIENTEAARSTLMDVDVSAEITKFSSEQVLIQAGVSMLAQANQQPSLLLRLLQ